MDNIAIHCHKGHFGAQLIGDFHLIETNSLPIFHLLCHFPFADFRNVI